MVVESMKKKAMADIKRRCELSKMYNEGLADGYAEGYEKALADMKETYKKQTEKALPESTCVLQEKELKPAIRFLGNSMQSLIDKVVEECDEVVEAFNDGETRERIAEELADVQLACEIALAGLGYHEKERRNARLKAIQKNAERNYYMPPREMYGD